MHNLFAKANEMISSSQNIAIITHINTDGDAIGSSLGLYHYLINIGKNVDVFIDSIIPDNLTFLPGIDIINNRKFKLYDLVIVLDANDEFRIGNNRPLFYKYKNNSLLIDHHTEGNTNFCKVNIVVKASSTCEIIAEFLFFNNTKITNEIAQCLIAGTYTDTGKLSYSSATYKTFNALSKIIQDSNVSIDSVTYPLYNSVTKKEFNVRKVGYSRVEFFEDEQIAVIALSNEDIKLLDIELYMTKSLLDIVMPLKSIKIVALLSEFTPNTIFCSFRTKENLSARKLAMQYGGNGHENAAGCKIKNSILEAEKKNVIELCKKLLKGNL